MTRVGWAPPGAKAPKTSTELGKTGAGSWFVAEDAALIADRSLLPLYLSRPDYERAMRKLSAKEIAAAVTQRLAVWSNRLPALALDEVVQAKRPGLSLAARAGAEAYFELSLSLMVRLGREGMYGGLNDAERLDIVYEHDATLLADLASPEGARLASPEELALRRRFTDETAGLLAASGRPDYRKAPLFLPLERAYLVKPPDQGLLAMWADNGVPRIDWDGGVIGPIAAHRLAGVRATLVDVDWPALHGLALTLTRAQLEVALRDRFAAKDLGMPRRLQGRRLEAALVRRAIARKAVILGKQIEAETRLLRSLLAAAPAWLEDDPRASLRDRERAAAATAAFLAAYTTGDTSLRLAGAAQTIEADLRTGTGSPR